MFISILTPNPLKKYISCKNPDKTPMKTPSSFPLIIEYEIEKINNTLGYTPLIAKKGENALSNMARIMDINIITILFFISYLLIIHNLGTFIFWYNNN